MFGVVETQSKDKEINKKIIYIILWGILYIIMGLQLLQFF